MGLWVRSVGVVLELTSLKLLATDRKERKYEKQ